MDADVIKPYVEPGMGVGIVASIAFDPERDRTLRALEARALFEVNLTRLAIRRGAWLRGYVYAFIESFAPTLTRPVVEGARGAARSRPERPQGALKRVIPPCVSTYKAPSSPVSMPTGELGARPKA